MTLDEIKLHRLANQHLIKKIDCKTVLHDLCGVQAQFLSNAMHALKIRCSDFDAFDSDSIIKSWTLRGTMHLFSVDDIPLFLHEGRNHFLRPCDTLGADEYISRERKAFFAELIQRSVAGGIGEREALREICRENGMTDREELSIFNPWGGTIRALCECGRLCHAAQEKKAFRLCPEFEPMDKDAALLEMARRYFANYGPATIRDASYFFGCTQAEIKTWLDKLPVKKTECGGKTYFYMETGREYPDEIPGCIFLAGFDQLLLGYRKEDNPFLPKEHLRGIFSLAGIVNPAVLVHGRIVGKWKNKSSVLTINLFEEISEKDLNIIEGCANSFWPEIRRIDIKKENKK